MCIRDRGSTLTSAFRDEGENVGELSCALIEAGEISGRLDDCLLYTSDAADERSSVDLGGRRIIKKKTSKFRWGDGVYDDDTSIQHI